MNRRKKILSVMPDPQPHRNKPRKRIPRQKKWKFYDKKRGYGVYEDLK